jgi:hypothetical protein
MDGLEDRDETFQSHYSRCAYDIDCVKASHQYDMPDSIELDTSTGTYLGGCSRNLQGNGKPAGRHLTLPLTNPWRGARAVISRRHVDRQLLQVFFRNVCAETSLVRKGHSVHHNQHCEAGLQEVRTM